MKTLRILPLFALLLLAGTLHAQISLGVDSSGNPQPMKVDSNGNMIDSVGASAFPTFTASVTGLSPTSALNVMAIEAGTTKRLIIRKLTIFPGVSTANGFATLTLQRNTVAATAGGTAITAAILQHNPADTAFSGIARTSPTVVGVTTVATSTIIQIASPVSTTTTPAQPIQIDFTNGGTQEGFIVPAGVTNGLMFTHSGVGGAANFGISVDFTEG